ncbi:MAG: hypothetical protein M3P42_01190, partial [Actinomycetota bacterium]|nr:hypothetical protein [Actinomycetota bacterium]
GCPMFARLHSFVLGDEDRAAAGDVVEQVLPTIRALDGYRGMVILSELDGDRVISVSLWETEKKMEASRAVTEKIREAETTSRQIEVNQPSTYRVVPFDVSD